MTEQDPMLPASVLRLRRHREAMQLALAERLTLDQARERLDSYRQHLPRLKADTIGCFALPPEPTLTAPAEPADEDEDAEDRRPWWNRD